MKRLFGGILLAMGILIAGASGLCSLTILFGSSGMTGFGMFPLVLLFGGIPFAVGAAIAFGGRALLRADRREREKKQISDYPEIFG
ncbi:MAG TPA: hypothetical protein VFT61_02590 [Sphingomicrobium sp.]|nr:hypothetical protein [Sphingomicrobium sp.]